MWDQEPLKRHSIVLVEPRRGSKAVLSCDFRLFSTWLLSKNPCRRYHRSLGSSLRCLTRFLIFSSSSCFSFFVFLFVFHFLGIFFSIPSFFSCDWCFFLWLFLFVFVLGIFFFLLYFLIYFHSWPWYFPFLLLFSFIYFPALGVFLFLFLYSHSCLGEFSFSSYFDSLSFSCYFIFPHIFYLFSTYVTESIWFPAILSFRTLFPRVLTLVFL